MITIDQNIEELRDTIKKDIDTFNTDRLREISDFIAFTAGKRAGEVATKIWEEKQLTTEKVDEIIAKARAAKRNKAQ